MHAQSSLSQNRALPKMITVNVCLTWALFGRKWSLQVLCYKNARIWLVMYAVLADLWNDAQFLFRTHLPQCSHTIMRFFRKSGIHITAFRKSGILAVLIMLNSTLLPLQLPRMSRGHHPATGLSWRWSSCGHITDLQASRNQQRYSSFVRISTENIYICFILKDLFREACIWSPLDHRHILPFLGIFAKESRLALVSQHQKNGSLYEFLLNNPDADRIQLVSNPYHFSLPISYRYMKLRSVASGLKYLHSLPVPVMHGDIRAVSDW